MPTRFVYESEDEVQDVCQRDPGTFPWDETKNNSTVQAIIRGPRHDGADSDKAISTTKTPIRLTSTSKVIRRKLAGKKETQVGTRRQSDNKHC